MKTAKIFLSILGVTLATLSFGQLISLHETNNAIDLNMAWIMESEDEVLFYTAEHNPENGRTVHRINHNPNSRYHTVTSNAPMVSRVYFTRNVKAMYEEIPVVETWMIIPFESSLENYELQIEDWMITPFEYESGEETLEIEPWMTSEWI